MKNIYFYKSSNLEIHIKTSVVNHIYIYIYIYIYICLFIYLFQGLASL
jgi:hypothetical protein